MATYLGFSTQNVGKSQTTNALSGRDGGPGGIRQSIVWGKKFKLVDAKLVVQDLINAMNIRKGTKVGNPGYGTALWDYVFETNTLAVRAQIENEVRRLARLDPRIILNSVAIYSNSNGVLIELQMAVAPINEAFVTKININLTKETASLV
jgi:phage baseplate assembly protein W